MESLLEVDKTMSNLDKGPTTNQPAEDGGTPETSAAGETQGQATTAEEKPVDVQALQQELGQQKKLAQHHLDQWRRAEADLQNYRKRAEKERSESFKYGTSGLLKALLPILDDFERALLTCPDVGAKFTWTEGVALIDRKLLLTLEQHGLQEVKALGKPFDPGMHEAFLAERTSAYPDGHVSAVLQKGYRLHDRMLRPVMVKVARNESAPTAAEAGQGTSNTNDPKEQQKDSEAFK
jgi:molecular chaperone GrpE